MTYSDSPNIQPLVDLPCLAVHSLRRDLDSEFLHAVDEPKAVATGTHGDFAAGFPVGRPGAHAEEWGIGRCLECGGSLLNEGSPLEKAFCKIDAHPGIRRRIQVGHFALHAFKESREPPAAGGPALEKFGSPACGCNPHAVCVDDTTPERVTPRHTGAGIRPLVPERGFALLGIAREAHGWSSLFRMALAYGESDEQNR